QEAFPGSRVAGASLESLCRAGSCLADEANKSMRRPAEERDRGQGRPRVKRQPRIDLFPLGTSPLVKNFTIDSFGQVAARVDESQAISERKG
ncbi:MAG: hypothetical protein WBZ24_08730, partial [Anaerolineales bacterium]